MRIPVAFSNLKTQALIDTSAAASFLEHRLLICIPYNDIKELQVKNYKFLTQTYSYLEQFQVK